MTLPHEQEFELYHYGESLCSQMVRLALCEKQIAYKSHHMHLELNAENLSRAYRKINPKAVVPVLVHQGAPIYNSWEIIKYLDSFAPQQGTQLWPSDPESRARIDAIISENALKEDIAIGANFGTSIAGASTHILAHILKRRAWLAVVWDYLLKHPLKERALAFIVLRTRGSLPGGMYEKFIKTLAAGLVSFERELGAEGAEKEFFFGDYSMIDTMITAHFHRLEDVGLGLILSSPRLPYVKRYWERLHKRPSYQEAILDQHSWEWREAMEQLYGGKPSPYFGLLEQETARHLSA